MLAAEELQESTLQSEEKETPAAAACAPGKGSRPAWARKGSSAGAGQAGLHYPPRTPPTPASEHVRNYGACAELGRLRGRVLEASAPGTASGSVGT